MRVLALDTTTSSGSVAIVDDSGVLVEAIGDPARSHAERLPGDILQAVDHAGIGIAEIDVFAVAAGPGTFTGLRIGIAMIQGLALVSGKHIVPVSAPLRMPPPFRLRFRRSSNSRWLESSVRSPSPGPRVATLLRLPVCSRCIFGAPMPRSPATLLNHSEPLTPETPNRKSKAKDEGRRSKD
jgi:hypothetical protein